MVTEADLNRFLKENPPARKFVPYCYVNAQSDTLTVYFEGDADYSKRLNDHLTLYLSLETKEIVGCRIKGIACLLQDLPNYINIKHEGVNLALLFFAFRGGASEVATSAINDLARVARERNMILEPQL